MTLLSLLFIFIPNGSPPSLPATIASYTVARDREGESRDRCQHQGTWYGHDPAKFDEFRRRYLAELTEPGRAQALARLPVTPAELGSR
jgi:hypothetical protein